MISDRQPSAVSRQPSAAYRILFMGTPAFAVPALEALIASPHEIAAVYTQPPRPAGRGQKEQKSPVHLPAEAHGIPVFTPASLKSPEAQAEFAAHRADVAVVAAYGLLLPKAILEAPRLGCVNIHPSLLPRWRGAAPIQRALMAGDAETGVCIMQMDAGLDTGAVLSRERFLIPPEMNAGSLHDALAKRGAALLLKTLEKPFSPQPQATEGITYAAKITKEDCRIDWAQPASVIHHRIRALSPSPGAFFLYQEEPIKVFASSLKPETSDLKPGTFLDNRLTLACGTGTLQLLELQRPGKKRMPAEEFLKGFPIPQGTCATS